MSGKSPQDIRSTPEPARERRAVVFNVDDMAEVDKKAVELTELGNLMLVTTVNGPRLVFMKKKRKV